MLARQILRRTQSHRESSRVEDRFCCYFFTDRIFAASRLCGQVVSNVFEFPPAAIPYRLRPTRPAFFRRYLWISKNRMFEGCARATVQQRRSRPRFISRSNPEYLTTKYYTVRFYDLRNWLTAARRHSSDEYRRLEIPHVARNLTIPSLGFACLCLFPFHRISISLFSSRDDRFNVVWFFTERSKENSLITILLVMSFYD